MDKLYMTVNEAAAYVGIGPKEMRKRVNSSDPPPYLEVGNRKLLQVSGLAPYFERKQAVRGDWR